MPWFSRHDITDKQRDVYNCILIDVKFRFVRSCYISCFSVWN